jgi:hypothetical protein
MVQQRNIGVCILLSIITCGIYQLFWMGSLSNDVSYRLGEEPSGVVEVLLGIITCGLYFIYWNYKMGRKLLTARQASGKYATDNSLIYLLLSIFGLNIISVAIMQNDFNEIC